MLLLIEKCYSIIEYISGTDKIFIEATNLYNETQIGYLKTQILFYSNPKEYPTRKAFRQALEIIIELKNDWNKLKKLWYVFYEKYEEINEVHKHKKFFQSFKLVNYQYIQVGKSQKNFRTIIELIVYGIEKIQDQISDLQVIKRDLEFLDFETKKFANQYSNYKNEIVTRDKIKIFRHISKQYKNKDFCACENYLANFNENVNFKTGEFFDDFEQVLYKSYGEYSFQKQEEIDLASSIYFERIQNNQCLCDLEEGILQVALMQDCPVCTKPYGRPFS